MVIMPNTPRKVNLSTAVAIGVGASLLGAALGGTGVNFYNYVVENSIDEPPKPVESFVDEPTPSMPIEENTIDSLNKDRFIVPEPITLEDGSLGLKVPKGYALYLVDRSKKMGMVGVQYEGDYVINYDINEDALDSFVGIDVNLKFVLNGTEGLISSLKLGKLDVVNGMRPEARAEGLFVPDNYMLYHLPSSGETYGDFVDTDSSVETEDGRIYVIPEGYQIDEYVAMHPYFGRMFYGAGNIKDEMEEFYDGHISKTIN